MTGILRVGDEVGSLVRIGLQVEQLQVADLRIGDQFPAFIAHGALDLDKRQKDGIANLLLLSFPEGAQAFTFQPGGGLKAERVTQGGKDIQQVGEGFRGFSRRNARSCRSRAGPASGLNRQIARRLP